MILPDFILPSRQNQHWEYSGIDSPSKCLDKQHFKNFPYNVSYVYNSRGFRDKEWPDSIDELKKCIWCFGDSFTVGIGSPIEHTWTNILERITGLRCINVSMDGASNNWISYKVKRVIDQINPDNIVIQWSYFQRGEKSDNSLSDEDRRIRVINYSDDLFLLSNFHAILKNTLLNATNNIIHSFIPEFMIIDIDFLEQTWINIRGKSWPLQPPQTYEDFLNLPKLVANELRIFYNNDYNLIKERLLLRSTLDRILTQENVKDHVFIEHFDKARDGHHYDVLTSTSFVEKIKDKII